MLYSTNQEENVVLSEQKLPECLVTADGGRNERLIEKSLPTYFSRLGAPEATPLGLCVLLFPTIIAFHYNSSFLSSLLSLLVLLLPLPPPPPLL